MPELPDVAIFARRTAAACDRRILDCLVDDPRLLRGIGARRFCNRMRGASLKSPQRHGKYLLLRLDDGPDHLILHFGMTGWPSVDVTDGPAFRMRLDFADGGTFGYHCQRILGLITLTHDATAWLKQEGLGPDALDLPFAEFRERMRAHRGQLKPVLMDQETIAGIGNIYADEICYQAGIDPRHRLADLDDDELRSLHRHLQRVLHMAIERDADPRRFPRTWLLPHREDGAEDPRGSGQIRKVKVGGRGTFLAEQRQH